MISGILLLTIILFFTRGYIKPYKIPCYGCDDPVGTWYTCMNGTGKGSKACEIFKKADDATNNAGKKITEAVNYIGTKVTDEILNKVPNKVWSYLEKIMKIVNLLKNTIYNNIITAKDYVFNGLKYFFSLSKNLAIDTYDNIINNILIPTKNLFKTYVLSPIINFINLLKNFRDLVTTQIQNLTKFYTGILIKIKPYDPIAIANNLFNKLMGVKDKVFNKVNVAFSFLQDLTKKITDKAFEGITAGIEGAAGGLDAGVNLLIDGLNKSDIPINKGIDGVNFIWKNTLPKVIQGINKGIDGINDVSDKIPNLKSVGDNVSKGINTPVKYLNIGIRGYNDGINFASRNWPDGQGIKTGLGKGIDGVNWFSNKLNPTFNTLRTKEVAIPVPSKGGCFWHSINQQIESNYSALMRGFKVVPKVKTMDPGPKRWKKCYKSGMPLSQCRAMNNSCSYYNWPHLMIHGNSSLTRTKNTPIPILIEKAKQKIKDLQKLRKYIPVESCPNNFTSFNNNTQCSKNGYSAGKFNSFPYRCSLGSDSRYPNCINLNCPNGWSRFDNTECYKNGYGSGNYNNNTYRCSLGNSTRYNKCYEHTKNSINMKLAVQVAGIAANTYAKPGADRDCRGVSKMSVCQSRNSCNKLGLKPFGFVPSIPTVPKSIINNIDPKSLEVPNIATLLPNIPTVPKLDINLPNIKFPKLSRISGIKADNILPNIDIDIPPQKPFQKITNVVLDESKQFVDGSSKDDKTKKGFMNQIFNIPKMIGIDKIYKMVDSIANKITEPIDYTLGILINFTSELSDLIEIFFNAIKTKIIPAILSLPKDFVKLVVSGPKMIYKFCIEPLFNFFKNIAGDITDTFTKITDTITNVFKYLKNTITSGFNTLFSSMMKVHEIINKNFFSMLLWSLGNFSNTITFFIPGLSTTTRLYILLSIIGYMYFYHHIELASLLYNFILNSVSQLTTGILQFIAVITFQMSFTDTAIGNLIYTLFQSIISLF